MASLLVVSIGPRGSRGWWHGDQRRDQLSAKVVSIGPRGSRGWWRRKEPPTPSTLMGCFNRAARFARLVATKPDGAITSVCIVSIGPRGSRGWWRVVIASVRLPTRTGFNRAARFARLVAAEDAISLAVERAQCFNRAARFARLVAGCRRWCSFHARRLVSIGPRGSRGWWHLPDRLQGRTSNGFQ